MSITKRQIQDLDTATLLAAVDWLYDSNKRLNMSGTIGRQSKAKQEYERALRASRDHCLEMLMTLAEIAAGRRDCADSVALMTCPRCDSCGWPVIRNYGDEYSILCPTCAGVYKTGVDAVEYINKQSNK